MFEIGAVGCIPAIKWESVKCVEEKSQLVSYLNDGLLAMLRNLTTCLKGSNFVLGHSHWLGYDAATNPSKYGNFFFLYPSNLKLMINTSEKSHIDWEWNWL